MLGTSLLSTSLLGTSVLGTSVLGTSVLGRGGGCALLLASRHSAAAVIAGSGAVRIERCLLLLLASACAAAVIAGSGDVRIKPASSIAACRTAVSTRPARRSRSPDDSDFLLLGPAAKAVVALLDAVLLDAVSSCCQTWKSARPGRARAARDCGEMSWPGGTGSEPTAG